MDEKICQRCGRSLPVSNFCKNKRQKDGLNTWCKECTRAYKVQYYAENKERLSQENKARYAANPEKYRAAERERRAQNVALYNERALQYQKKNREKVYARQNAWAKAQRKNNPNFNMREKVRRAMYRFVKGIQKGGAIIHFLGCSYEEFRAHIEKQFTEGMTWETYGSTWTVDHIKPLTAFDLTDPEQLAEAVHYTNTQPLSLSNNVRKGGANRGNK